MNASSTQAPLTRKQALTILGISLVIVYLIWNIPLLSWVGFPLRLFVTYVHEAGHSIAALITGGKVTGFVVSADGSGVAYAVGGWRVMILPAGYVGAATFGAGLFYLVNRHPHWSRRISMVLGMAIILFTVLYARPDETFIPLALFVGVLFGALLVSMGLRNDVRINLLVLSVLSITTGLNAVMDITNLTGNASACWVANGHELCNDAAAFSAEFAPGVPPEIWAYLWSALAIWLCFTAVYYSIIRPAIWGRKDDLLAAKPKPDAVNDPFSGIKLDKDGHIDWSQFK